MARTSRKLTFNSEFFKSLLSDRKLSVPEFSKLIDVSKQTMYDYINEESISREYLVRIGKYFDLNRKDFDLLMGIKPLPIFFRRERRVEVEEEKKEKVRILANVFLKITKIPAVKKHLPKFEGLEAKELAKEIRSTLELGKRKVLFDDLVTTLKDFGVYTYFYPFDFLGINDESGSKKVRAASVPFDGKWIIFLDTSNELIDSLYDLIHELAHIFSGHDLNISHDDDLEKYCNDVANEVLTPSRFFEENSEELKKYFAKPAPKIVGYAEQIVNILGCSFEGLILALDQNKIIDKSVKGYLYAVCHNKKKNSIKLSYYFNPANDESVSSFWKKALNDSSKTQFYDFFIQLKCAFLEGRATTRLLAEGFGIDISSADVLCKMWISENEFSEEELERFKDGPWQSF